MAAAGQLRGRNRECGTLDGLLGEVRTGQSAVLVLRGEAGIGKTALLRHLTDAASGFTVTRCAGVESEMELPFAGLNELCSPILDGLGSLPEPQQRALSGALGLEAGGSPDKFLVALGALGLIGAASERGPLLCVVEDAHWLDNASAQVLAFVGRRLRGEPVGLVFAARASLTTPDHLMGLPELRIEGVDERAARALLRSVGGMRIDETIRARILDETRGNPLAVLELGARMMTAGFAGGFAMVDGPSLSERIEDEYRARLSDLPYDTQQLALLAAADPVGDTGLIQRAAAHLGLGVDAADAAVAGDLLSVGASVRFRHPLLRSAVYRGATGEQRRVVHQALAEASDPESDADRRAWHRAYAATGPDEQVAGELIGSAGRAQARGGIAAAAAFWERAVALTPDAVERSSRALSAAQSKFGAGDLDAAGRLLDQIDAESLSEFEQAIVDLLRAQIAFARYRGGEAPNLLLRVATRLRPINPDMARLAFLQALIATSYAGRLADPEVRLEIARAAQALPRDPAPTPAIQLLIHGIATWQADGYAASAGALRDAVRQYLDDAPDPDVVGYAFIATAVHLCDDAAWYTMVTRQVELARERGMLSWLPFVLDGQAEFLVPAGDLVQAEALLAEAGLIDPVITAATSPRIALLVAAWRGDIAGARGPLEVVAEAGATRGEGWLLAYADYANAVLYNGLADHHAAADAAQSACADGEFVFAITVRALYELVEATARSNQPARAVAAAEQLSAAATASGTDFAGGMAAHGRALVAEGDDADGLYREAVERLGGTRMAAHVARARLSYGEWLRRADRRDDAREQLRSAHASFAAMGANGFAERARHELLATGEKVRRRAGPGSADLTPQEEQIAQLARQRRTNPEIGAELFLSARTVEWHLRKIFAKLEIKSRRELDAALADRGA
ncbi:AAA family ATPase [Mycobacterium sp. URHB0044]|jgi:DNA-binding CsgD family transcriptional regulator|uniref:ATP-binding protein n=1 Tax=Mycobacterium sp. URHB0044 TaxID=1380386 RepID=UPI00048E0EDA|nr:LuxR family transcriptional regulator [Mycobacterium sp. URHB0044]